ncbi:MAG: rhomboid family intramembrane serine protease [Oceanicaulis sp.]
MTDSPEQEPRREPSGVDPSLGGARPPMFNMMAPVIVLLGAAMLGVQVLESWAMAGGGGMVHGVVLWLGTLRTGGALSQLPPAPVFGLTPYVLHVFVHFGWLHLLMNLGALIAFGPAAARPFGAGWKSAPGFLIFFFTCAVGGALATVLVNAGTPTVMAGASTALSGVIAGAGFAAGGRGVMTRIALPWLAINVVLALIDLVFPQPVSWEGHIGGLITGFAVYPLLVRLFAWR